MPAPPRPTPHRPTPSVKGAVISLKRNVRTRSRFGISVDHAATGDTIKIEQVNGGGRWEGTLSDAGGRGGSMFRAEVTCKAIPTFPAAARPVKGIGKRTAGASHSTADVTVTVTNSVGTPSPPAPVEVILD
jgi:hypothetical protein